MVRGFSVLRDVQTGTGAHTASYSMDAGFLSGVGVVKWLGLVVNHSPPSSAKVKNGWHYTLSTYAFMVWTGTTLRFREDSAIFQE